MSHVGRPGLAIELLPVPDDYLKKDKTCPCLAANRGPLVTRRWITKGRETRTAFEMQNKRKTRLTDMFTDQ